MAVGRSRSLDLQRDRTSVQYQQRLHMAGARLLQWCLLTCCSLENAAKDPQQINDLLILYLQHLYDRGKAFWWGPHSILYVQTRWRSLKGHLRQAWDSVSTWKMEQPVRSRVPFRYELVQAVSYAAVLHAVALDCEKAALWWSLAVVLRLGFFGLLRPKEICQMRIGHVVTPGPGVFRSLSCVVLSIIEPKNRMAMGRLQVRLVRDLPAVLWTSWFVKDQDEHNLLWPFGPAVLRTSIQQLLKYLNLHNLGLCPSGLRTGGATALLEQGTSIASIRFAGGWASDRNLAYYLQEAESAQTMLKIVPSVARRLERFLCAFDFLDAPPSFPFSSAGPSWSLTTCRDS